MIEAFLATAVGSWLISKGLDKVANLVAPLLRKKLRGTGLLKDEDKQWEELRKQIEEDFQGFKEYFQEQLRDYAVQERDQFLNELKSTLSSLDILPRQEDLQIIVRDELRDYLGPPVQAFMTLAKFISLHSQEQTEDIKYVERGDERRTLEKFVNSDMKVMLIWGQRGTGKTRLAIEFAKMLSQWEKNFCFVTPLRALESRDFRLELNRLYEDKELFVFVDDIESSAYARILSDFIHDPSRLKIRKLRLILTGLSEDFLTRTGLRGSSFSYQMPAFSKQELRRIAELNSSKEIPSSSLNLVVELSGGYPDTIIAAAELAKSGIGIGESVSRESILTRRFELIYNEAKTDGEKKALRTLAFIHSYYPETDERIFKEYFDMQGLTEALNNLISKGYIFVSGEGETVYHFKPRRLFALYLVEKFYINSPAWHHELMVKFIPSWVVSRSLPEIAMTLITFQANYKQVTQQAIGCLVEQMQEQQLEPGLFFNTLDLIAEFFYPKSIVAERVDRELMRRKLDEFYDEETKARCTFQMGMMFHNFKQYNEAEWWYDKSFIVFEELGDKKGVATTLYHKGLLQHNQYNYPEAVGIYRKALGVAKKARDRRSLGATLCALANIRQKQGDCLKAYKLGQKSLEIYGELEDKQGIARVLLVLGDVELSQAMELYVKGSKLWNQGSSNQFARDAVPHFERADKYYKWSLQTYEEEKDIKGHVNVSFKLAQILYLRRDFGKAESLYKEILDVFEELEDMEGVARTHLMLGSISFYKENDAEALEHCLVAEGILTRSGLSLEAVQDVKTKIRRMMGNEAYERLETELVQKREE